MKKILLILGSLAIVLGPVTVHAASCTPFTTTVNSGTSTRIIGGGNAVLADVSPLWTTLPGSKWIWNATEVANPNADETVIFTENIIIDGNVSDATLSIAGDDYYTVTINNVIVAQDLSEIDEADLNFISIKTHNITSSFRDGNNVIEIKITNSKYPTHVDYPEGNPAGVIYSINLTGEKCLSSTGGGSHSSVIGSVDSVSIDGTPSSTLISTDSTPVPSVAITPKANIVGSVLGDSTVNVEVLVPEEEGVPAGNVEPINIFRQIHCLLLALIIIVALYILSILLIRKQENLHMKRLLFIVIGTVLAIVAILIWGDTCPILYLIILSVLTSLGVYKKNI